MDLPKRLQEKLKKRKDNQSLRKLPERNGWVDFSSNDYLGLSSDVNVFHRTHEYLIEMGLQQNGATGSRLISGNHPLYRQVEDFLCGFHQSEAALIFNSGYDVNIGFFSCVPQRGDVIVYDELSHASIRDGISMSHAKAYKFKHNDLDDLKSLLERAKLSCSAELHRSMSKFSREVSGTTYIVTESVFSMDGDTPDLKEMIQLAEEYKAHLIVDEAHAIGVFGRNGKGLVHQQGLQAQVFARIITFGKALGCHGAAVLCCNELQSYLINFSRSFIYTTGLPPHSLAAIAMSYDEMQNSNTQEKLRENIRFFRSEITRLRLLNHFIESNSAIHCIVIPGNQQVKTIAKSLKNSGFDVKPILSPTVPEGRERIRFCLHSHNSFEEITNVLETLRIFVVQ